MKMKGLNIYKYHSYFVTLITFIGSAFFMLGFDMFLQAKKNNHKYYSYEKKYTNNFSFQTCFFYEMFFRNADNLSEKTI